MNIHMHFHNHTMPNQSSFANKNDTGTASHLIITFTVTIPIM